MTENRNYDIDQFDWNNEEDSVTIDQLAVDEVDHHVRTALQVTTPVQDHYLRPSAVDNDRARIVYNVPYSLDDEQKGKILKMVGDVRTITFNATGYHDHPLSHVATEISEDLLVRKFGDEPFVSVYGNYARHRRLGHTGAKVVTSRHVPHDWFRNRGCEESATNIADFFKGRGHLRYRIFLATHALYYMSLEDVARTLGGNPNAEFHAIIHRHQHSHGMLNMGEIAYKVDTDGRVTQRNPLTGFAYSHDTLEGMFHVDSCRVLGGQVGLAWDINKLVGDNYHVKIVLCDPARCANLPDPKELIKHSREVLIRGDVSIYRMLGYSWYVYHRTGENRILEDVQLFDRLRRTIAGKPRTPRARDELMAMCRRLANKNDIISIHQGFAHEVAPELMADYVNAAFYCDVQHELECAIQFHRENKDAVAALNKYLSDGTTPADFTTLKTVGKAVALPFATLGGLLHDATVGARVAMFEEHMRRYDDSSTVRDLEVSNLVKDLNNQAARMAFLGKGLTPGKGFTTVAKAPPTFGGT